MKNISLYKPIVLRKSLDDMTDRARRKAEDLLCGRLFISFTASGLEFIENKKGAQLPEIIYYGSEAVCIYRQALGLPDVSIRRIRVNDILSKTPDFDSCFDILFFLNSVSMQNSRAGHLQEIGAPAVILCCEYIQLQQRMEFLENNSWSGQPIVNSFDVPYEGGGQKPDHYEEIRKSLNDIGLSLLPEKNAGQKRKGDAPDEDTDAQH